MKIVVVGGTGLIGSKVSARLAEQDVTLVVASRAQPMAADDVAAAVLDFAPRGYPDGMVLVQETAVAASM